MKQAVRESMLVFIFLIKCGVKSMVILLLKFKNLLISLL